MTKFFEPIDVSATHIYHSALELCPTSSIVRKLYYDRCHGIARFPRVVIGNPDSWDQTTSFSGKNYYGQFTWSPCGRFIAAQTVKIVEIRNQLTFQLLAVLQPPKNDSSLKGPLAYSPDGRSLACGFSDGILIWDTQTGGIARSIGYRCSMKFLVWSLDGRTITSTSSEGGISSARTYDVASSAQLFESSTERDTEYVCRPWAHEKSIRAVTLPWPPSGSDLKASISELGPTRTKIEPLHVSFSSPFALAFSPSTHRFSTSGGGALCIMDARNSHPLLEESGDFSPLRFSSDGSLFAAARGNGFRVWKYTSDRYLPFGEFLLPRIPSSSSSELLLQFSPTSASILSRCGNVLQVWRLDSPPVTVQTRRQLATISRSGRYIATAHESQSGVTITDLYSQTPSQFIDTGGEIEGLVITGNVLLVAFSDKIVGWLLTEEGRVAGVVDDGRASLSDSIWTVTSPPKLLCLRVSGQAGMIGTDDVFPFTYHTGTGGFPDRVDEPPPFGFPWLSFYKPSDYQEYHYLRHDGTPPKDGWLASRTTTGKAAWVVDPEGRHRLWVPVEWRAPWHPKHCHQDITTLFTRIGDQPVIIKF